MLELISELFNFFSAVLCNIIFSLHYRSAILLFLSGLTAHDYWHEDSHQKYLCSNFSRFHFPSVSFFK